MMRARVVLLLLVAMPLFAEDGPAKRAAHAVGQELLRYRDDAKSLAPAPLHWDKHEWERFGEGVAVVASLYATDHSLYAAVQENRSRLSNNVAKHITPFVSRR